MNTTRVFVLAILLTSGTAAMGQGSFVNWESPPVHPVEMTPDGTKLLVTNTADGRLEIFTLGGALPVWTAAVPVGLEPVAVRARTNNEAWVVNLISDSVSIVNLTTRNVTTTIFPGDEPTDVVFAGNPQKAFVCVSAENQLKVYDPANLAVIPTSVPIQGADPRALATDGTRVFAAIFHSGNRSMILPAPIVSDLSGPWSGQNPPPNSGNNFNPPLSPGLPTPPPVALIVNKEVGHWKDDNQHIWDTQVTWNVTENEVAVVQASNLAVTYAHNMVNNINMAITVQPGTGRVTFTGHYLRNEARFETVARAQFNRVNICGFDPLNPPTSQNGNGATVSDMNQHLFVNPPVGAYITNPTPQQVHLSVSDPRSMAWNTAGSAVYVSGMGTNNIIKTTLTSQRLATIDVGQGPTGLAFDGPRNRLYCLNRFDANVSIINTTNDSELGRVGFYDPTPAVIRTGRPHLYDAHLTSRLGQASCASCHVDARSDAQDWDLGDPSASMLPFDENCNTGIPFAGTCNDWHPMKGPMMTQPLIGLAGADPLHWRGDRPDFNAFKVGFTGLLGAPAQATTQEMQELSDFLATIKFAPNPFRTMDDALPASVPGFTGNPSTGEALFHNNLLMNNAAKCADCHSLPSGGQTTIVSGNVIQQPQALKIPQLQELYRKNGFSFASQANIRGFGFTHDGSADTIFAYLHRPQFTFSAGATGDQQRHDLEAFIMCFPTNTHAAIGTQLTVDAVNKNTPEAINLLGAMTVLADGGQVALVARGVVGGIARGYKYLNGTGNFRSDRHLEYVSASALRQSAAAGGEITFTIVPSGTQTRIGVDRDEDGFFDRDELDAGTDPNDPASFPAATPDVPTISQWGEVALALSVLNAGAIVARNRRSAARPQAT